MVVCETFYQNKTFYGTGSVSPDGTSWGGGVRPHVKCLSCYSVPCHRYHWTQGLFRGQLFQAIESRSKRSGELGFRAVQILHSPLISPLSCGSIAATGMRWKMGLHLTTTPYRKNHKYDRLSRGKGYGLQFHMLSRNSDCTVWSGKRIEAGGGGGVWGPGTHICVFQS